MKLDTLFGIPNPVIGMLHAPALPGSPQNTLSFEEIIGWVLEDADALASGGIHGLILENFGDAPFYPRQTPPHTATYLTRIASEVKQRVGLPLGINVLRNDAITALAVAAAAGAEFVRINVHTGARLTDQGLIEGAAHSSLRYRREIGAEAKIFADVDVKHSAPLAVRALSDEVQELVERGRADAVIVSGSATGKATSIDDLRTARHAAGGAPVIAGSGVQIQNVVEVLSVADGVIVGTSLKHDGITTNRVDANRVREFMRAMRTTE